MKKTLITVAVLFALLLTGCHSSYLNDSHPNDLEISDTDYPIEELQYDWNYFNTSDELAAVVTDVYSGKVTSISFEIIDETTGLYVRDFSSVDKEYAKKNYSLNTVYTISVGKTYKGSSQSEMTVVNTGGISGYRENEQHDLLVAAGLDGRRIPVAKDGCNLAVGNIYLFCVYRFPKEYGLDYDNAINPYQYAHKLNSSNAKAIINSCK